MTGLASYEKAIWWLRFRIMYRGHRLGGLGFLPRGNNFADEPHNEKEHI